MHILPCPSERKRRIFPFRAGSHSRCPSLRGAKRRGNPFPPALSISGKSADLPGYKSFFLSFWELRFLPLWEESSKEAHEGGERKISPPCDPPLCAPKASSFDHPPPRMSPICRASNEMFRAGNTGSVSDEARGKRFFALRPQNDKRRQCMSCFVILSEAKNLSIPRRFAFPAGARHRHFQFPIFHFQLKKPAFSRLFMVL